MIGLLVNAAAALLLASCASPVSQSTEDLDTAAIAVVTPTELPIPTAGTSPTASQPTAKATPAPVVTTLPSEPVVEVTGAAPSLDEPPSVTAADNSPTAAAIPPSPTPAPTPTAPSPQPPPGAPTVNGIARAWVAYMPEDVLGNSREIFARGQQLGRNPRAFSKVGDSVIAPPFFEPYDVGNYDLGIFGDLEGVIQYFGGSFGRDSASQRIGLHSWTVFDPMWADKSRCEPNEGSLPCEIRLHNPSFLVIRLGSNDVGVGDLYAQEMRRIVEYSIENGIVPILGTKADRNEGSNYNNQVVRTLAAEYQIPLWDFDRVAETIPGRGLDRDGVHLNGDGHFMQNVSGLVMLDRLWREVVYARAE